MTTTDHDATATADTARRTDAAPGPEWIDQDELTRAQKALLALSGEVARELAEQTRRAGTRRPSPPETSA